MENQEKYQFERYAEEKYREGYYEEDYPQEYKGYFGEKKDKREYFFKVTLCQLILCTVFVSGIFTFSKMSDENYRKIFEGLDYLREGNLTSEIETVKDYFRFNVQV